MSELKSAVKPFDISKWEVWEAYEKVKANKGAPGVDGVDLAEFETDLKDNLYLIWNRMSSGSYFPPPVQCGGDTETAWRRHGVLGVPTVADRIAQTVVAGRLEAKVEPIFHPDSYGYRPKRSALDAVGTCRERCWKYDWVIDLDVQKFFDSVAVGFGRQGGCGAHRSAVGVAVCEAVACRAHAAARWHLATRDRGTPQGSAISPVLANLFLHYAFDAWMAREFPTSRSNVCRRCGRALCQRAASRQVLAAIADRMVGSGCGCIPTKPGSCTARTLTGAARRAHVVYVPGLHVPRPRGTQQARGGIHLVSACGQQGRLEEDGAGGAAVATASTHRSQLRRSRPNDQPDHAGVDELLRGVLPVCAYHSPRPHQHLLGAVGPQEIQAVPGLPGSEKAVDAVKHAIHASSLTGLRPTHC